MLNVIFSFLMIYFVNVMNFTMLNTSFVSREVTNSVGFCLDIKNVMDSKIPCRLHPFGRDRVNGEQ